MLERTPERDLLPMADHFELSVLAWGPVGAGVLTGKYTRGGDNDSKRAQANEQRGRTSERALAIARAVDQVADELGVSSAQVAIAWVLSRGYRYVPIVGARKVEQIADNLAGYDVRLNDAQLEKLDSSGAWLLLRTRRALEESGRKVSGPDLPDSYRPLLENL